MYVIPGPGFLLISYPVIYKQNRLGASGPQRRLYNKGSSATASADALHAHAIYTIVDPLGTSIISYSTQGLQLEPLAKMHINL